ncbi:MAG: condensation domain-containing protein [Nitrospirales bacterium]
MTTLEFLTSLRKSDVTISVNGERLQIDAPPGVITPSLKVELKNRKEELLHFLRRTNYLGKKEKDCITPIARNTNIPLSPSQERIWSLTQLMPLTPSYNMHTAFNVEGALHIPALIKSIEEITERHESLRTTFSTVDGNPVQTIAPNLVLPLSQVDLRTIDETIRDLEIQRLIHLETRAPFDLTKGPLLRVKLLQADNDRHVLVLTMHHIISDGWSFFVFFNELSTLYEAIVSHKKPWLAPLQIQYADFSGWHRDWLKSEQYQKHVEYWRAELGNHVTPLILPLDQPRPNTPTLEAASQTLTLPSSILEEWNTLGTHQEISHNIVFLTAFLVVLFKYSGQEDIIICSPVSGRSRDELKPLIGFFNNIVPIRIMLNTDISISELLKNVRIKILDVLEYQDVPLHHIVNEAHVDRVPLTRAMFDFQSYTTQSFRLPAMTINPLDTHNGAINFELALTISEREKEYSCTMEYKTSLFTNGTIQQLLDSFETVLEHITRIPEQTLSALSSTISSKQQNSHQKLHEGQHREIWNKEDRSTNPDNPRDSSINGQNEESQENWEGQFVSQRPRNSLEIEMTTIWEELLATSPIGRHENFFELGGHSLLAVNLFSKIETTFGEHLPLSTILHAPTIEQLAKILAKDKHRSLWNSVVPIQMRGSKPPIFAAHPISGHVLTYTDLSEILGNDQPFYGIQSLGLNGKTKPFTRIEDMAAHYIREIEDIQPQGPYFLVGGCMGGLVALEMAQQFHAKGKHVAFLGMMDTWLPAWVPDTRTFNPDKFPNLGQVWDGSRRYYKQLRAIGAPNWIPHTFDKIQVFINMARKLDVYGGNHLQKSFAHVLAANLQASETYNPKPYAGKITYFLASARKNVDMPDPRLEWKAFAREGLEIIRLPAPDSGQLLNRPYVLQVGAHITAALQLGKE